jgi:hypothetical protein
MDCSCAAVLSASTSGDGLQQQQQQEAFLVIIACYWLCAEQCLGFAVAATSHATCSVTALARRHAMLVHHRNVFSVSSGNGMHLSRHSTCGWLLCAAKFECIVAGISAVMVSMARHAAREQPTGAVVHDCTDGKMGQQQPRAGCVTSGHVFFGDSSHRTVGVVLSVRSRGI